jgi:hypothetical protein
VAVPRVESGSNETLTLEMLQPLVDLTKVQDPERADPLLERSLDRVPMEFAVAEKSENHIAKQHVLRLLSREPI